MSTSKHDKDVKDNTIKSSDVDTTRDNQPNVSRCKK
jgi:hypothetical protein